MFPQTSSLVKFSTPVLVSIAGKKVPGEKLPQDFDPADETHKIEDILGQILPPKEFIKDNGQLWIQTVLSTPATKIQVVQLQEQLDKRLKQRQARQFGICPQRQQLFSQCFDELIRQITIDCRQRGLLLVSARDEYMNQINAYKNLYESSITYGMKKVIDSQDAKSQLNAEISKLQKQCAQLQRSVTNLQQKLDYVKKAQKQKREQETIAHKKEVTEIKEANQQLKNQIQSTMQRKF